MKRMRIAMLCLVAMIMCVSNSSYAQKVKKSDLKVNYVLHNIGVKRDVQAKLKPIVEAYLADKKAANKEYDDAKTKLKNSIKTGTLTEKQAQALLNMKWQADEKELAVKRQYETKFKTVLPVKKVYLCFSLLNDSKSKMLGEPKDDSEE